MYRLDRSAFKAQTLAEADNQVAYWLNQSPTERLRAANYLIRAAWNIAGDDPMRLDRTQVKIRHRFYEQFVFGSFIFRI